MSNSLGQILNGVVGLGQAGQIALALEESPVDESLIESLGVLEANMARGERASLDSFHSLAENLAHAIREHDVDTALKTRGDLAKLLRGINRSALPSQYVRRVCEVLIETQGVTPSLARLHANERGFLFNLWENGFLNDEDIKWVLESFGTDGIIWLNLRRPSIEPKIALRELNQGDFKALLQDHQEQIQDVQTLLNLFPRIDLTSNAYAVSVDKLLQIPDGPQQLKILATHLNAPQFLASKFRELIFLAKEVGIGLADLNQFLSEFSPNLRRDIFRIAIAYHEAFKSKKLLLKDIQEAHQLLKDQGFPFRVEQMKNLLDWHLASKLTLDNFKQLNFPLPNQEQRLKAFEWLKGLIEQEKLPPETILSLHKNLGEKFFEVPTAIASLNGSYLAYHRLPPEWFQRKFVEKPEGIFILVDLIRFIERGYYHGTFTPQELDRIHGAVVNRVQKETPKEKDLFNCLNNLAKLKRDSILGMDDIVKLLNLEIHRKPGGLFERLNEVVDLLKSPFADRETLRRLTLDTVGRAIRVFDFLKKEPDFVQTPEQFTLLEEFLDTGFPIIPELFTEFVFHPDRTQYVKDFKARRSQLAKGEILTSLKDLNTLYPLYATLASREFSFEEFQAALQGLEGFLNTGKLDSRLILEEIRNGRTRQMVLDLEPYRRIAKDSILTSEQIVNLYREALQDPIHGEQKLKLIEEARAKIDSPARWERTEQFFKENIPHVDNIFTDYLTAEDPQRVVERFRDQTNYYVYGGEIRDVNDRAELNVAYSVLELSDTKQFGISEAEFARVIRKIDPTKIPPPFLVASHTFKVREDRAVHVEVDKGIVHDYRKALLERSGSLKLIEHYQKIIRPEELSKRGLRKIKKDLMAWFETKEKEWIAQGKIPFGHFDEYINKTTVVEFIKALLKAASQHLDIYRMNRTILDAVTDLTWESSEVDHLRARIESYHPSVSAEALVDTLGALEEFYGDHWLITYLQYFGKNPIGSRFFKNAKERLKKEREGVQYEYFRDIEILLLPSKRRADAFYGYIGETCIGHFTKEIYNPNFTPVRIIADGRLRGVVHALRVETPDGKRHLILFGIEPQNRLRVNPRDFISKIHASFIEEAKRLGFDTLLAPSLRPGISDRAPILDEVVAQFTETLELPMPVVFPRDSYYRAHEFLVLWKNEAVTLNPPTLLKENLVENPQ